MKLLGIAYENRILYIGFVLVSFEITIGKKKEPVTYCDLNDEEIDELSKEVWERPWLEVHRKFARAILRKAQEK